MTAPKFTTSQVEAHNAWVAGGCIGAPPGAGLAAATVANVVAPVKVESPLEALFLALWKKCDGPELEREVELVSDRKYRVDFVHELSKICLELQGFKDHTSAKGFHRDNEKHWALAQLGYRVITWDRKLVNEANVWALIRMVRK